MPRSPGTSPAARRCPSRHGAHVQSECELRCGDRINSGPCKRVIRALRLRAKQIDLRFDSGEQFFRLYFSIYPCLTNASREKTTEALSGLIPVEGFTFQIHFTGSPPCEPDDISSTLRGRRRSYELACGRLSRLRNLAAQRHAT